MIRGIDLTPEEINKLDRLIKRTHKEYGSFGVFIREYPFTKGIKEFLSNNPGTVQAFFISFVWNIIISYESKIGKVKDTRLVGSYAIIKLGYDLFKNNTDRLRELGIDVLKGELSYVNDEIIFCNEKGLLKKIEKLYKQLKKEKELQTKIFSIRDYSIFFK